MYTRRANTGQSKENGSNDIATEVVNKTREAEANIPEEAACEEQVMRSPLSNTAESPAPDSDKEYTTMQESNADNQQSTTSSAAAENGAGSDDSNELEKELQDTVQHVKFILKHLGDYEKKQAVASYVYMNLEGIKVKGGIDYYNKALEEQFSSEEKKKIYELEPYLKQAMRERGESFEELYQSLKGEIKDKLEAMVEEEKKERIEAERRVAILQEKIDDEQKTKERMENEREELNKREELLNQVNAKFQQYCDEFKQIKNEFEKLNDSSEAGEIFKQFKKLEAKIPPWVFKNSKFLEENSLPRVDLIISDIYKFDIVRELSDFKQIKTHIKEIKESAQKLKQYAHNSDTQLEKTLMQKHLTELEQIVPNFMWLNIGVDSEDPTGQYQITQDDFVLTPTGEQEQQEEEAA